LPSLQCPNSLEGLLYLCLVKEFIKGNYW
jgi:hypothetical protein